MPEFVCGLDFGTLSCRAVIVNAVTGETAGEAVSEYAHGVITGMLPDGTYIPPEYALQDAEDYPAALSAAMKEALAVSKVAPEDVKGIGLDFTSATILPVDAQFRPLSADPRFSGNPHSFVKLWKHHGAKEEAGKLTEIFFGGAGTGYPGTEVSPEHAFPKILETLQKAPEIYENTYRFLEAGDYINTILTGKECHSAPYAGYKLLWKEGTGFPEKELLSKADSKLSEAVGTKISEAIQPLTAVAGTLGKQGALLTGLLEGTAVAEGLIDAHAAVPGAGAVEDGDLVITVGTSACHMLNAAAYKEVPGIFGCMKDGVIPGLYTYEAGQSAVGDIFSWFAENLVPASYAKEAGDRSLGIYDLLCEKAARLSPGGNGLVATDWLNGCRTPCNRADLPGVFFGLTLSTKPEEIYRALMESMACGTRRILENYEENGAFVKKIFLCGGIPQKNPLFVQILADVLQKPLLVVKEKQCAARGSAVLAAVTAGIYPDIRSASKAMRSPVLRTVVPKENYDAVYQKYRKLGGMTQALILK